VFGGVKSNDYVPVPSQRNTQFCGVCTENGAADADAVDQAGNSASIREILLLRIV
jgi:hypothetical protein